MPELNVSRKTISQLFTAMQSKKFIVPEYQRPYKWDRENCETLWNDITDFHRNSENNDAYFLGTFVSFKKMDNNIEIIDGQQRITSLFLLLRAFYKKLEDMPQGDIHVQGLKNQIAPCIWDVHPISQLVENHQKIHIQSLVATDEDQRVFHDILATGNSPENSTDLYSKNYTFFLDRCESFAQEQPMLWQPLCITILHRCIVLPIECDVQDTALTIFSTLNDRGMPLSDSDIFKAQIYQNKPEDEKETFTQEWKELTSICEFANISLEDLFRFNSHVIRAMRRDRSKEIALRKFYAQEHARDGGANYSNLMNSLKCLADFWLYVNINKLNDGLNYEFSIETKKILHCLSLYPNEFWKYATSVFFLKNKEEPQLDSKLNKFLKKMMSFLFVKYIMNPSANAIKSDIYQLCIDIYHDDNGCNIPNPFNEIELTTLKTKLDDFSSSKLSRALILLHAYINPNQEGLIDKAFDIEHIFPKRWQNTNYNGWDETLAKDWLEKFGNKVAIERKLNIQAGNNYFGNKKSRYRNSSVANVRYLGNLDQPDWMQNDIAARNDSFISDIIEYFSNSLNEIEANNGDMLR